MDYYLEDRKIDLDALQKRLKDTDLIPSQQPLLVDMSAQLAAITQAGVTTLAELRRALKTEKSLAQLSQECGVDAGYLRLLNRTIKGFFPKPRSLGEVDWLGAEVVADLKSAGIRNTRQFFEAACEDLAGFAKRNAIAAKDAEELLAISDLCRIQWVSPSFARVLVEAGYRDAGSIAVADPEVVFEEVKTANQGAKFYKGTVGLRDVGRLVFAAGFVPRGGAD